MKRLGIFLTCLSLVMGACSQVAERNNAANSLITDHQANLAVDAYLSAQVYEPDNPVPYLNSARAYYEQGNIEQMEAVIEQVILRGDNTQKREAYYNLGNFYVELERYPDAIQAYRQALLIYPEDADSRHNLELAMALLQTPTPESDELKTEPDQSQVNPTSPPTEQPLDFDGPTPTPPRIELDTNQSETDGPGGTPGAGPATPFPRDNATLSVEQAQRLLDPVAQDQTTIGEFSDKVATPGAPNSGKEW